MTCYVTKKTKMYIIDSINYLCIIEYLLGKVLVYVIPIFIIYY